MVVVADLNLIARFCDPVAASAKKVGCFTYHTYTHKERPAKPLATAAALSWFPGQSLTRFRETPLAKTVENGDLIANV